MKINDEGGYIGIGTLIVFISTILIAAVAASAMIFTVQMVAQQAKKTAIVTVEEISSGLRIIDAIGDKNINGSATENTTYNVQVLMLTVKVVHGSPDINFDDIIVYITDFERSAYLKLNNTTTSADPKYADNETYLIRVDIDNDNSFRKFHVISDEDIVTIIINIGKSGVDLYVSPQNDVMIKLIPRHGEISYDKLTVLPSPSRYVRLI